MTNIKCDRCKRKYRNRGDWNVVVEQGHIVGYLCPKCQTVEENTEAVINESTINYGIDPFTGQLVGTLKEEV